MDVLKAYTLSTSAWLGLQSLSLLVTPKLIVSLAATEPRRITDLETYLCRSFGLAVLTLALVCLLLTDTLPLATTTAPDSPSTSGPRKNPYGTPIVIVTTTYHALSAFYLYAQIAYRWNFAFTAGLIGESGLFCFGLFVLMFGSDKVLRSKTTGADKRTSNWPFENKESARSIKKEEREKEKEREKDKGKRRSVARTKSSRE